MEILIWKVCLIMLGIEIILGMMMHLHYSKILDIFDPFYWSSAVYFAVMVIAPYVWVVEGKTTWHGAPVLENLVIGTFFFGVSYAAFTIASVSRTKSKADRLMIDEVYRKQNIEFDEDKRLEVISWFVFIAGLIMSLIYLRYRGRSLLTSLSLGTRGTYSEDLSATGSFWFLNQGTRVMMCGVMMLFSYSKRFKLGNALAFALTFMLVLSSGKRNQLMVIVLAPIIFFYLLKEKRPKLLQVIGSVVVFVFILGLVGIWRSTFFRGGTIETQSVDDIMTSFMVNIEVFFPYYTMLSVVPSVFPYQFGASYLYTFIQFIPRALWAGKPVSPATDLASTMFGMYAAYGPAYCNYAEMYLDFGVLGMIIGMGIFAIVSKKMYEKGCGIYANKFDMISFSLFLPYLFEYITRGHFPSVATEVFFMWGPLWVTKFLIKSTFMKNR